MTPNFLYGITGLLLLTLGRRLFWLFVAAMGMAAGLAAAQQYTIFQPYWMMVLAGLAAAIAGALLAIFFQRVAIAVAGLAAGGTITAQVMAMLGFAPMPLITLAGAVAGAIVLYLLFDWGLIALSSLAGAALIAQVWPISPHDQRLLFQISALLGILFQSAMFLKQKKKSASPH